VRAQDIFDIVLERVRECQALSGRITAIRPDASAKGGPPAVGRPQLEYVADFAIVGRRALRQWPSRVQAFELYYVQGLEYRAAIAKLMVRPGTFDWWCSEIKRTVGPALAEAGLFPPRKYRERSIDAEDTMPEVRAANRR
jgi:hypothetical protein